MDSKGAYFKLYLDSVLLEKLHYACIELYGDADDDSPIVFIIDHAIRMYLAEHPALWSDYTSD